MQHTKPLSLSLALFGLSTITLLYPSSTFANVCELIGATKQFSPDCDLRMNRTCNNNSRILAAHYHYNYDFSDKNSKIGFAHKPQSWKDFSYRKWKWHKAQLRDMLTAGISLAAIDWAIAPEHVGLGKIDEKTELPPSNPYDSWQFIGLENLVKGYGDVSCGGRTPPALAPYFNPVFIDPDSNPLTQNGFNLRTQNALEYAFRSISAFFCLVPRQAWATYEDRPIVFLGPLQGASEVESNFFDQLNASFLANFGTTAYFVKQREDIGLVAKVDPRALHLAQNLVDEQTTYDEVVVSLLASDEFYMNSGAQDAAFLKNAQWKLFKSNEPTDAFTKPWTQWISKGQREQELTSFIDKRKEEYYSALLARWYKQFAKRPEKIEQLTKTIQHSKTNIREAKTWLGMLRRGVHYDAVRVEILASDHFYELSGNSAEIYLRRLYETLYFRCPTHEDLAPWQELISKEKQHRKDGMSIELRREISSKLVAAREAKRVDVYWLIANFFYRTPGWPGFSDATFSSSGASCQEFQDVASIGPGIDQSKIPNISDPTMVDRQGGSYYSRAWRRVLSMNPKPVMVYLQSWNNFHNATELTRSKEFGQDFIALTRQYSAAYRDTGFISGEGRCP